MKTIVEYRYSSVIDSQWSEFMLQCESSSVFQTPYFYHLMNSVPGHKAGVILAKKEGSLVGVLGYYTVRYLKFLPFFSRNIVFGGPVVKDNDLETVSFLLSKYRKRCFLKHFLSEFRNLSQESPFPKVFEKHRAETIPHLDIHISTVMSADEIFNQMEPTRKKQINRSYKRGVTVRKIDSSDADSIHAGYLLVANLYKEIHLPPPPPELILNAYALSDDGYFVQMFAAFYETEMIGCRFVLCYKDIVYDWYAASNPNHYDKYPNDVLPWEVLKWSAENGYKYFDFGGAGHTDKPYGVRDYKLKFGGTLTKPGRYLLYHIPGAKPLVKLAYKLKGK